MFTKIDKDYAKSTSVYENTWKTEDQEGTIVPEHPQQACQRHCSEGTLEPEWKYRLAWIHPYAMNSLTFLAIRHKGERDHANWPILSCQLPEALASTHGDSTGTTGQEIQPAQSILLAERGCHEQLAVLYKAQPQGTCRVTRVCS